MGCLNRSGALADKAQSGNRWKRPARRTLKSTWVNNAHARDWEGAEAEGQSVLQAATSRRRIFWIPYGGNNVVLVLLKNEKRALGAPVFLYVLVC